MKRQIVLDTETTGLDPAEHRMIEVAGVELQNRAFTGNYFHRYLNPMRAIDQGALAVHGITNEFLADKPLFKDIQDELFAYLEGAELIIHNAPFDLGFLDREFNLSRSNFSRMLDHCIVIDTLVLARKLYPQQPNNLDALCKRTKVDNTHRGLHGALKDARLLGEVYLRITGGQTHFDLSALHAKTVQKLSDQSFLLESTNPLVVLKATEEEQAMHEAYLDEL